MGSRLAAAQSRGLAGVVFGALSALAGAAQAEGEQGPDSSTPPPPLRQVPAFKIRGDKLGGEPPHLPDAVKLQSVGKQLEGLYRLCLDREGRVSEVRAVQGIAGADDEIARVLRTWTFRPQPEPLCFIESFRFVVHGEPATRPTLLIKKDKLSGELPHLPDDVKARYVGRIVLGTYKICVDTRGVVRSVRPVSRIPGADEHIQRTLMTWRFRPQPVEVCFIDAFQFVIAP